MLARRLMAGHRSLEPAVVVRIHPGQSLPALLPHPLQGAEYRPPLPHSPRPGRSLPALPWGRQSPPDPVALREGARRAQRGFEARHRNRLPEIPDTWSGGGCDEQLGWVCLRFKEGVDWLPAPERAEIVQARESLLATLAEVGSLIPGDRWVLGQRVRCLGGLWPGASARAPYLSSEPGGGGGEPDPQGAEERRVVPEASPSRPFLDGRGFSRPGDPLSCRGPPSSPPSLRAPCASIGNDPALSQ